MNVFKNTPVFSGWWNYGKALGSILLQALGQMPLRWRKQTQEKTQSWSCPGATTFQRHLPHAVAQFPFCGNDAFAGGRILLITTLKDTI